MRTGGRIPKNARRDANEPEIIRMLREVGATVQPLSIPGAPDLLVGWRQSNMLMEVKTLKGTLTEDERDWHDRWRGRIHIVRTIEDALSILGIGW